MDAMLLPGLREDLELVNKEIRRRLKPTLTQGRLRDILTDVTGRSGKRYRPLLALLSARCGQAYEAHRPLLGKLGAVIEMIHMASLVHDDIVDNSPLRRGQATVQSRYGKDMAVYTGDFLLARTMHLVFTEGLESVGDQLCEAIERMCRGEIGQFDCRFRLDTPVERYLENISGKTVALFETAMRLGCQVAGGERSTVEQLARFGRHLGYLFQIRDDLLDFLSSEAREGKPIHADFREGVFTLPVLMSRADPEAYAVLSELAELARQGRFSEAETQRLTLAVQSGGGLEAARAEMAYHSACARRLTEGLPAQIGGVLRGVLDRLELPD